MQILKKTEKKFFSTCHIIKILLNGLTYNPAEHFTRFSHFSSPSSGLGKIRSKLVKRPDYMSSHSIRYMQILKMTFEFRHFMETKFSLRKDRNTHSISIFFYFFYDYVMGDFNLFMEATLE